MSKASVWNVRYFIQKGLAMGGKSESVEVIASTQQKASDYAKEKALSGYGQTDHGPTFVLVGVEKIGAQG